MMEKVIPEAFQAFHVVRRTDAARELSNNGIPLTTAIHKQKCSCRLLARSRFFTAALRMSSSDPKQKPNAPVHGGFYSEFFANVTVDPEKAGNGEDYRRGLSK